MRDYMLDEGQIETFRRGVVNTIADVMDSLEYIGKLHVSEIGEDRTFIVHIGGRGIVLQPKENVDGDIVDAEVNRYVMIDGVDGKGWSEVSIGEPHRPKNSEDIAMETILESDAIWMMFGRSALA